MHKYLQKQEGFIAVKKQPGMIKNYLFGCDWGTSSFRLRLINITDHQIIGERLTDEGISNTYNAWKANGESSGISRYQFFREQLKKQIQLIAEKLALELDDITIIISGMASSSIGMEEIPYSELPFAVDGSQSNFRCYTSREDFPHRIILISGVKGEHDVMRGEETELIGLLALLDASGNRPENSILIFPGTHSKHLYIQNDQLVNFHTFMTGEVFNLMANFSILQNSVEVGSITEFSSEANLNAFKLGIRESVSSNILNSLFSVRTNQLFQRLDKKQNSFYLSGLLIGGEIKSLCENEDWQLILCSGSNLFELYKLAMEELDLLKRTTTIPADLIDKAAIAGQIKIFQILKNLPL